jgi:hypothetical protein
MRGNLVVGELLRTTSGNTMSTDDEFPTITSSHIDKLFGNLNMGGNTDVAATTANVATVAANPGAYMFLSFLFQILLEFRVMLFGVDAISLFCLDDIFSSTLLIFMFSLFIVSVVMIYQLFIRIKPYDNLLIYLT